jgi:hypothetical protein
MHAGPSPTSMSFSACMASEAAESAAMGLLSSPTFRSIPMERSI